MLLYDKQSENYSSYFHKDIKILTKLNVAIFKDLGEGVVMVKLTNI